MPKVDIVRAWKDREYRESLSESERSQVPENPAGMIELDDTDLKAVGGGIKKGKKKIVFTGVNGGCQKPI